MATLYDWHEFDERVPSEEIRIRINGVRPQSGRPPRLFLNLRRYGGDELTVKFEDREIGHVVNEIRKESETALNRFQVQLPEIGTRIYSPEEHLDVGNERWFPASVCVHDKTDEPMVTIIPLGAEPWYVLSPWGNGPGIVGYLQDYDGGKVFGVEVVSHPEKMRSVDVIVIDNGETYER